MEVYFIQIGEDGPIKIGIANNTHNRKQILQTAHHRELIIRHIETHENGNAKEKESLLHDKFKLHRIRGEWFRPVNDILEYIGQSPLSWEKIIALDDDLKLLYEDAMVPEYEEDDFHYQCPKLHIWYRFYKPKMFHMVGFGRNNPPEELQGTEAYEICYQKIINSIPCSPKCKYFGAPCTHVGVTVGNGG